MTTSSQNSSTGSAPAGGAQPASDAPLTKTEDNVHLLDRLAVVYRYRRIAIAAFVLTTVTVMILGFTWLFVIPIGLIAALGVVLGLDYMDDTIKTPEDIARPLNIPVLGLIPAVRGEEHPLLTSAICRTISASPSARCGRRSSRSSWTKAPKCCS